MVLGPTQNAIRFGDHVALFGKDRKGYIFSQASSTTKNQLWSYVDQEYDKPFGICDNAVVTFVVCTNIPVRGANELSTSPETVDKGPKDSVLPEPTKDTQVLDEKTIEAENRRLIGRDLRYGQVIQLRHNFSKKYVHFDNTKRTKRGRISQIMCLSSLQSHSVGKANFCIRPRYKGKVKGDIVQAGDSVMLESLELPSHFIQIGSRRLVIQGVSAYEVILGVCPSALEIYRCYRPTRDDEKKAKGGAIVRLFHNQIEAFLSAEGSFTDEDVSEEPHLRVRPPNPEEPKSLRPPSSAITYWQIEAGDCILDSEILKWTRQIRLRHMTTSKYLHMDESGKMSLCWPGPDTLYKLHPVNREHDYITFDNFVRIEHIATGRWLHAVPEVHCRQSANAGSCLAYDDAVLQGVLGIENMREQDVFTLQVVNPSLVEDVRYAAGTVLALLEDPDCLTTLIELKEFMIVNGIPNKSRQKLLRNFKIVDLLVRFLQQRELPDDLEALTYTILETYLQGNSRKNELYFTKYLDFFLLQVEEEGEVGRRATTMMTELFRDNRLLIGLVPHDMMEGVVELVKEQKKYHFLDFLGVLCICEGVGLVDNQKFITQCWLDDNMTGVFLTDLGEKIEEKHGQVYVSRDAGGSWQPLHDLAHDKASCEEYRFLESQIDLFGKVTYGRNNFAIDIITKSLGYLTWKEAFTCLKDERLPQNLRAKYCWIVVDVFVDVGDDRSVLDFLHPVFEYDTVCQGASLQQHAATMPKDPGSVVRALKDWLPKFLDSNKNITNDIWKNMLIEQVLRMLKYIITYGYYSDKHLSKLLGPLLNILDGTNDRQHQSRESNYLSVSFFSGLLGDNKEEKEYRESGRFSESPKTSSNVDAKYAALEVLELIMNIQKTLRLEKYIECFKTEENRRKNRLFSREANRGQTRSRYQTLKELYMIRERTTFVEAQRLKSILLDLCNYKYDKLVLKSLHVLRLYYSADSDLFASAVVAQVLITDKSREAHNFIVDHLPPLHRLAHTEVAAAQEDEICTTLRSYCKLCHLEGEPNERNQTNQTMLVNHGVLEIILDMICKKHNTRIEAGTGEWRVVKEALVLLQHLAQGNTSVQNTIFEHFDTMLTVEGVDSFLASALVEVFIGNKYTCMEVVPEQIGRIMTLVALTRAPEWLDLFCVIMKIEELDQLLKTNQVEVLRALKLCPANITEVLNASVNDMRQILSAGEGPEALSYVISLLDLLVACTEGEKVYTEMPCETNLSVAYILAILEDDAISNNIKRPWVRFLHCKHVNISHGNQVDIDKLAYSLRPWLNQLPGHIQRVTEYAQRNGQRTATLLHRPPAKSALSNTDEDEIYGSLHFLLDAALPLLTVIYQHVSKSYSKTDDDPIKNNVDKLMTLTDCLAPLVCNEVQFTVLQEATVAVMECSLNHEVVGAFVDKHSVTKVKVTPSEARKEYIDSHRQEELLNMRLNLHACQDRANYDPSCAADQITTRNTTCYSEEDYGPQLPSGREFYSFVQCFSPTKPRQNETMKLLRQFEISSQISAHAASHPNQVALDVTCLQVLRALFDNEDGTENYTSWVSQNSMLAVMRTMEILERNNDDVRQNALAFLDAMFIYTHTSAQKAIEEYCLDSHEERFFFILYGVLSKSIKRTKSRRMLQESYARRQRELQDAHLATKDPRNVNSADFTINNNVMKRETKCLRFTNPALAGNEEMVSLTEDVTDTPMVTARLVLRLITSMCSGRHTVLQNYVREQPDNLKSVNIVAKIVQYLCTYIPHKATNPDYRPIVQALNALSTLTIGNTTNQHDILENDICDCINNLLRMTLATECPTMEVLDLWKSIAHLLSNIVLEVLPETNALIQELCDAVEVGRLADIEMKCMECSCKKGEYAVAAKRVAYMYTFIMHALWDSCPDKNYDLHSWKDISKVTDVNFVEVVRDGTIHKVYFSAEAKPPHYKLRRAVKEKFKWTIKRTSQRTKLNGLLEWSEDIQKEISYQRKLSCWPKLHRMVQLEYGAALLLLSLIINLLMIFTWRAPGALGVTPVSLNATSLPASIHDSEPIWTPAWTKTSFLILAVLHNVLSLSALCAYIIIERPQAPSNPFIRKRTAEVARQKHLTNYLVSWLTFYYVMLFVFSVLGTVFNGYFFALHLLSIVHESNVLQRVVKAITLNGVTLMLVTVLLLFIIYIFALVAFALLRGNMDPLGEGSLYCQSLGQCVVSVLHTGVIGTIYEYMKPSELEESFYTVVFQSLFHLGFFIIVTTVGLNIVFGVILDTFSELRTSKWEAERDMKNTCFICGRPSYDFEVNGIGFTNHVKGAHNLWNYIFFLVQLSEKPESERSSMESYVAHCVESWQIDFFPVGRALGLKSEEEGQPSTERAINELTQLVEKRLKALNDLLTIRVGEQETEQERREEEEQQMRFELRHGPRGHHLSADDNLLETTLITSPAVLRVP